MKQKAYFPELESLRGIAALMICFEHVDYWRAFQGFSIFPNLYLFVDFFFVLSGFVIALNFSQRIDTSVSLKDYLVKRLLRIYPLFLFTSIPYFGTSILKTYYHFTVFQTSNYFKLPDFFTYITLTFKWGFVDDLIFNQPTWSISVELFLYIVVGLLFLFSKNKKLNIALSAILCIVSFVILAYHDHALIQSGRLSVLRGVYSFFMGVIIYYLFNNKEKAASPVSALVKNGYFLLTIAFMAGAFLLINSYPMITFVFPLLWAMIIYLIINHKYPAYFVRFLNLKYVLFLGTISYSFYLTNPMMTFVTEKIFKKARMETDMLVSVLGTVFLVGATILVSKYTYRFIEIPGKNIYSKLKRRHA